MSESTTCHMKIACITKQDEHITLPKTVKAYTLNLYML